VKVKAVTEEMEGYREMEAIHITLMILGVVKVVAQIMADHKAQLLTRIQAEVEGVILRWLLIN